jgi:hypothetical protein
MESGSAVGVWATGPDGAGPIVALNSFAREFSDWGDAAQPGSKAAQNRDQLAGYDEADNAIKCVTG